MAFTYLNTQPSAEVADQLFADCETYLINETLPLEELGGLTRVDWVNQCRETLPLHTQVIKDGKVVCWFAGTENNGFANYILALVSPDNNGSRAYWYDVGFWDAWKQANQAEGFSGFTAHTKTGTSLAAALTEDVAGKDAMTTSGTTDWGFSQDGAVFLRMTY